VLVLVLEADLVGVALEEVWTEDLTDEGGAAAGEGVVFLGGIVDMWLVYVVTVVTGRKQVFVANGKVEAK
jgi:hypothetical protein